MIIRMDFLSILVALHYEPFFQVSFCCCCCCPIMLFTRGETMPPYQHATHSLQKVDGQGGMTGNMGLNARGACNLPSQIFTLFFHTPETRFPFSSLHFTHRAPFFILFYFIFWLFCLHSNLTLHYIDRNCLCLHALASVTCLIFASKTSLFVLLDLRLRRCIGLV